MKANSTRPAKTNKVTKRIRSVTINVIGTTMIATISAKRNTTTNETANSRNQIAIIMPRTGNISNNAAGKAGSGWPRAIQAPKKVTTKQTVALISMFSPIHSMESTKAPIQVFQTICTIPQPKSKDAPANDIEIAEGTPERMSLTPP